jgi:hypothetical protein
VTGRIVRVRVGRDSCRVWVCGLRLHHGLTGLVLVGAGLVCGSRRLFVAGAALAAHDWRDWPFGMLG